MYSFNVSMLFISSFIFVCSWASITDVTFLCVEHYSNHALCWYTNNIELYQDYVTANISILFSAISPESMTSTQDGYMCVSDHPLYPFWILLNLVLMEKWRQKLWLMGDGPWHFGMRNLASLLCLWFLRRLNYKVMRWKDDWNLYLTLKNL